MGRLLLRLAVFLVVALAVFSLWALDRAGELRSLEPVPLAECTPVEEAPGAEDLTIHRGSGTAFVSSLDRRALAAGRPVNGRILAYDLASRRLTDVTPDQPGVFRPHGISLWEGDGELRLFVVNHPGSPSGAGERPRHAVEILRFDGERFEHLETVTGELLISPNDLAAVGRSSFYVTNDHGAGAGWRRLAEEALGLARASVVYYDGETMSLAAEGLIYANGIAVSAYGGEVYVAGTTSGTLYVFGRDVATGVLGRPFEIQLGTGIDNIELDRHGMLWIAAHPKLVTFARHRLDAERPSPSQVLWVDSDQVTEPPVRTVYLDLGEELSGSSVAAPFGNRLLIGSVFEGFLDCRLGG